MNEKARGLARQQEFTEEAARIALLPVETQRTLIAEQEAIASNPRVPKVDRNFASERARALKRLLFPRKKKKKRL